MRNALILGFMLSAVLASPAGSDPVAPARSYSPYAGRSYPTQVFWGDTHHHTANSGDAFMAGDRLSPEQAYRFARGEEVVSSTGVPAKLARALDFLCISDHAEGLGVMYQVYEGNPAMMSDPILKRWHEAMKAGGKEAPEPSDSFLGNRAARRGSAGVHRDGAGREVRAGSTRLLIGPEAEGRLHRHVEPTSAVRGPPSIAMPLPASLVLTPASTAESSHAR